MTFWKRRAMFYNILSQNFIVKCLTKSLLVWVKLKKKNVLLLLHVRLKKDLNMNWQKIIYNSAKQLSLNQNNESRFWNSCLS